MALFAVEDQQAVPRDALSFSSWISVLACLVRHWCLWLPAGAGRAQVGHVEQILFSMQGTVSPVPSGYENTPQCTSAKTSGDLAATHTSPGSVFFTHGQS